jgi:hypothetical protein
MWQNEKKQQVYLEVIHDYMVEGWFNNPDNTTYPLVGFIAPSSEGLHVLSFSVVWQNGIVDTPAITSWIGVYFPIYSRIRTTWTWETTIPGLNKTDWGACIFRQTDTRRRSTVFPLV